MSKLNIYKASAGSGKTFALTMEYFKIIFAVPAEYRNILAVTFTNKATEEMKSRIINELHRMAEGRKSSYGPELKGKFGFSDDELRNRAELLRTLLLHDYGRISVTTIDRFFQRIVKSFTKELGIFPGYNVELDSDYILLKAVDKVMEEVKQNASLRTWITDLMEAKVDEGKSWSIKSRMTDLGEELFKENYMLFDQPILQKFGDKAFLKNYRSFLQNVILEYENELTRISGEAIELIETTGLELRDFRGNKAGCAAHFYKLKNRKFDEITKTVKEAVDQMDYWIAKDSDGSIKQKIESIYPLLNEKLKSCVGIYEKKCRYYLSARQIADNLYQLGILNDLYQKVRIYCEEKGVMLLSDTTHILNILIAGNDTSFLFEKVGNYYKHLMIDEFQDTSSMQWGNFRPLVVNTLSEGNEALIVGDVKQSIYRWRSGDWSLLSDGIESELRQFGANNTVLENNWRSAPEIVGFNNVFFKKAAVLLKALFDESAGNDNRWSGAIAKAYAGLEQTAKSREKGYVDVHFGPLKKEENAAGNIMEEVIADIKAITERGGKNRDIVILVRSGKEGAFVADYLMKYNKNARQPIPFISNDSLYVWSSPFVKFISAVLRYIIEPYDLVNKASILYLYHTYIKQQPPLETDAIFSAIGEEDLFRFLNTDFAVNTGKVMSYSLFETVEAIIDRFGLKEKKEEVPYLIAFQDIIFEYEAGNSNSIHLFLEWWEKEQPKRVLSTSENVNAVRILTIHKSKGLEFEFVILPFCNWELDSVRPVRRIWCKNSEEQFKELDYVPLNYSARLSETIFEEDYYDEHLKAFVDNLNLLYVALTRARKEMYIRPYTPKLNRDGAPSFTDMGAFMYGVLWMLKNEGNTLFTPDADMNMSYGVKEIYPEEETPAAALSLDYYPVYHPEDRISVKYKYRDYAGGRESLSAVDEGKLLHEIFKSVEYAEDIEQSVQNAYLSGMITKQGKEEYCEKIRSYLQNPVASEWFSRQYKVINERDILLGFGSKIRPDRVIIKDKQVIVIDYKFGQSEENKYLKQIQFYRSSLKQMGYKEVKGYIWYVRLNKIVAL